MKSNYVIGAVAALAGIGATLGISTFLSMKSDLASMQRSAVAQTTLTMQPVSSGQSTLVAATAPASVPNFDNLPLCDQLDAVAKSGKSVAEFIAKSGRYSQFEANVNANCNWNAEQLKQAYAILHPPVVTIPTIVQQEQIVVSTPKITPHPFPKKPWNNCDGIQDPGESYSDECLKIQKWNDAHPNGPKLFGDNRVADPSGKKPEPIPYSAIVNDPAPTVTKPVTQPVEPEAKSAEAQSPEPAATDTSAQPADTKSHATRSRS